MTTLNTSGLNAATDLEIDRVRGSLRRRQARRTRSQYTVTRAPVFDAEQGHAEVNLGGGGVAYTKPITNGALTARSAVSLPARRTVGFVDAKPSL